MNRNKDPTVLYYTSNNWKNAVIMKMYHENKKVLMKMLGNDKLDNLSQLQFDTFQGILLGYPVESIAAYSVPKFPFDYLYESIKARKILQQYVANNYEIVDKKMKFQYQYMLKSATEKDINEYRLQVAAQNIKNIPNEYMNDIYTTFYNDYSHMLENSKSEYIEMNNIITILMKKIKNYRLDMKNLHKQEFI